MRKLILSTIILLIIGFAVSLFTGLWEKPWPEMERVEIPSGRVSLLLPKGAATTSPTESEAQSMTGDYCHVDCMEYGQASEDFPETEIYLYRKDNGVQPEPTRIRPDLVVLFSDPKTSASVIALLKHPDGGLVHIRLQFLGNIKGDAEFRKHLEDAILPSIQPGPAGRNLSERTETLDLPQAGVSLQIAVPQGFYATEVYSDEDDIANDTPPHVCKGMNLQWMRPLTRENNTFFMRIRTSKDALREDTLSSDIAKREGVLLGRKMEWSIGKPGERRVLVEGRIPYGPNGWHLGVSCLCPEEDLPTFFSIVEKIKPTETQPCCRVLHLRDFYSPQRNISAMR